MLTAPSSFRQAALLLAAAGLSAFAPPARAQVEAKEITATQNAQAPYVYTGRLSVNHGGRGFFGTATLIRRYTGLTCGHLLYNEQTGFSTNLEFSPHYYLRPTSAESSVSTFTVLSGYQAASDEDPDADAAFARDLGCVLFVKAAPLNDWAEWTADPDALLRSGSRLMLGYAAESYSGDVMAYIQSSAPYRRLRDGLYESTDYYTQAGMSGGPVFFFDAGTWRVLAETVAGTSPPQAALSDVRAITAEARPFLIEPEYVNTLVRRGYIKGAGLVPAGSAANYKCGVVFVDGFSEGAQLRKRYAELKLKAAGPNKQAVGITRLKTGKFRVNFSGLSQGQSVVLRLLRDDVAPTSQAPLAEMTVTAQ